MQQVQEDLLYGIQYRQLRAEFHLEHTPQQIVGLATRKDKALEKLNRLQKNVENSFTHWLTTHWLNQWELGTRLWPI